MEAVIKRWYQKVWITRGARFNAHSRLEKHANLSSLTISVLTVYIIALNIFPQISFLKPYFDVSDTGWITIILSVLILSISQYISSKEYKLKATKFHDCGKELSKIYEDIAFHLDNPEKTSLEDMRKISNHYLSIIEKYEENHLPIDREIFIRDNIDQFTFIKHPIWFTIKVYFSFLSSFFIYWAFITIPPLLLFIWMIHGHSSISSR